MKILKLSTLWVLTLSVLFLLAWLLFDFHEFWKKPLNLPNGGVDYYIERGYSFKKISDDLTEKKILKSRIYFIVYAFLTRQSHLIRYGEYHFSPELNLNQLFEKLVKGEVIRRSITFVEGWTFSQTLKAIASHPFLTKTASLDFPGLLQKQLGLETFELEGLFLPDTYFYHRGMTDLELFKMAHDALNKQLKEKWPARSPDLPIKTPYEALILASIVEKETQSEHERALVAGVFIERLQKGMKLQADPTVIYGLKDRFSGNLRKSDLQFDTPYNTYVHFGLPPTPIALPSAKSIEAVLNPQKTGALYFVAKGDGTHHFSKTLVEHEKAVKEYQLKKKEFL